MKRLLFGLALGSLLVGWQTFGAQVETRNLDGVEIGNGALMLPEMAADAVHPLYGNYLDPLNT